ncbi:hypothetical protein [Fischerella sp. JS2]|uniref:hypothetical protein n=1 Tax=Fischerella sp. JS2 TaxID=2597771 RepID=UPI0028E4F1AB|nr:hypothetical protein [Fischerella sp. JS2]
MKTYVENANKQFSLASLSFKNDSVNQNIIHEKPKLSMIWVKEYKGEREILVAKWIAE